MQATKPKEKANDSIAAVVAHTLRARILGLLSERTASPNELAVALKRPLSKVSYQVRNLKEAGKIELVDERKVRGAVEHFYRAIARPWIGEEEHATLTKSQRNDFAIDAFHLAAADVAVSLSTEVFSDRSDNCVTRTPLVLDEEGWRKVSAKHNEMVEWVLEEQAASDDRRSGTDDPGIRAESVQFFFERDPAPADWSMDS